MQALIRTAAMTATLLLGSLLPAQAPDAPAGDPFKFGEAVPASCVAIIDGEGLLLGDFSRSVHDFYVGREEGQRAVADLVNHVLITENMKRTGTSVSDEELDAHYQALDKRYREATKGRRRSPTSSRTKVTPSRSFDVASACSSPSRR
ncbi:MAG: hypothetical protein R3F20_14760 [Planctomycetota bacterium]